MASDFYLKIDGVKGETTAKGLQDYMEIASFSFGASNPTTIGSHGGGSAGDNASPLLFEACATGQHFAKATLVLRKAGGKDNKQQIFLQYDLEQVFVDSIQWSGAAGGDTYPMEGLSFSFGKVTVNYYPQDKEGKVATKAEQAFWGLRLNSSGK